MMENVIMPITRTSFDSAAFVGIAYSALNPLGLPEACFMLRIVNYTNTYITVSFDSAVAHDIVSPGDTAVLYGPNDRLLYFKKGQKLFVANAAVGGGAAVGLVYLSGYYR
jgi:hypothetical protein